MSLGTFYNTVNALYEEQQQQEQSAANAEWNRWTEWQESVWAQQNSVIASFQSAMDEANAANEERYQQGMGIYDEMIEMFQPGGGYGEGAAAYYGQAKEQAKASNIQELTSSGMANLTSGGGFEKSYEQDVGVPFWLNLNDMQMQALAGAMSCLLYTSPSPRDATLSRMPSSA